MGGRSFRLARGVRITKEANHKGTLTGETFTNEFAQVTAHSGLNGRG